MEDINKVFHSEIIRDENRSKNNLFDLINIVPAVPLEIKDVTKNDDCNFIPKLDKIYIPKRRAKVKVKTVRDIRDTFESDTYAYLTNDLEKQHNYLLKKIIRGSSKNEIINIAKKILSSDLSISKPTWQLLTNLNPNNHRNNRQFVLWNNKLIQVNGSIGGKRKLICGHDLATRKLKPNEKIDVNNRNLNKRKELLRNSLAVKFKPGPLCKKKFLDDSYQKYNSETVVVNLPRIGLDVQTRYGIALEPRIRSFVNNLRKNDGTVSQKWAEFAVSALGRIDKKNIKLISPESVTFDLKYKYNQRRILMRKYLDDTYTTKDENTNYFNTDLLQDHQLTILPEIKHMMTKILDAVEINVNQDNMFTQENDLCDAFPQGLNTNVDTTASKEKMKRRYCELSRLAVTVITLPDSSKNELSQTCSNLYCTLGCVCDSIHRTFSLREHCGREECMFDCKCDFFKYSNIHSLDGNSFKWMPAIKSIEDNVNMKMAKEEQKFHQTVIVTGEKNILLKSEKRNWKTSKKYGNFYKKMCLETVNQRKGTLIVNAVRINCENIEPWCMVHNLYKCFCKGRFTASNSNSNGLILNAPEEVGLKDTSLDIGSSIEDVPIKKLLRFRQRPETTYDESLQSNTQVDDTSTRYDKPVKQYKLGGISSQKTKKTKSLSNETNTVSITINEISNTIKKSVSECFDPYEFYCSDYDGMCSRVTAYEGRKYSDGHYKHTNYKIKEMEKNDKRLQERMLNIIKTNTGTGESLEVKEKIMCETDKGNIQIKDINSSQSKDIEPSRTKELGEAVQDKHTTEDSANDPNFKEFFYDIDGLREVNFTNRKSLLKNKNKLVTWLESNYKLYKQYADKGLVKTSLEAPKLGKVALYTWDFILGRYKNRKNLFLVSKQKPYRIFMGVNTKLSIFHNCMNINEIRFADLHKYPQTVKNLLTNANDLEDNFCILRGYSQCWELVGSVTKLNKNDGSTMDINDETSDVEANLQYNHSEASIEPPAFASTTKENTLDSHEQPLLNETSYKLDSLQESDSSKWFVMTIENDFSEIRFYKKGFFVKYDSILKAIEVARVSGKTVRLSSQKCVDGHVGPQFGVYAIPNVSEYCVFIGPYELQDSLGIETVKTILDVRKTKSTRGFWITTNKIDNIRVIDNPMSFMPLTNEAIRIPLENQFNVDPGSMKSPEKQQGIDTGLNNTTSTVKTLKKIRPIKINKSRDLYRLAVDGSLQKVSLVKPDNSFTSLLNQNGSETVSMGSLLNCSPEKNVLNISSNPKDDCEEGAPTIKITAVFSQTEESPSRPENKSEKGMFVLKPEEINRKLFQGGLSHETDVGNLFIYNDIDETSNSEGSELQNHNLTMCSVDSDVCVISDDDSEAL